MNLKKLAPTLAALAMATAAVLSTGNPAQAALTNYDLNGAHTTINFKIRHLVTMVPGRFQKFSGTIAVDPADFKTGQVNVTIDAASINTDTPKRDAHLKSDDFFGVEKFPNLTFKSTSIEPKDATTGVLKGDLTIRDVTKPVELQYTYLGASKDPWGNDHLGFEATGKINRQDYGVKWNAKLDNGGFLLDDWVYLDISVEADKEKPKAN